MREIRLSKEDDRENCEKVYHWNNVTDILPKHHDLVWCYFNGGKVFLGYHLPRYEDTPNKGWFDIEKNEYCWVNFWHDIESPVFDLSWKER